MDQANEGVIPGDPELELRRLPGGKAMLRAYTAQRDHFILLHSREEGRPAERLSVGGGVAGSRGRKRRHVAPSRKP